LNVTILGSCSVIDYPNDVERFFDQGNLVDIRNGSLMEMDVLPLYFLAKHDNDQQFIERLALALNKNLADSHGELWRCGVWGCNESHLRFTSIALRFMMLNNEIYTEDQVVTKIHAHLSHSEVVQGGRWFYHDSIETNKQRYYLPWQGSPCIGASANNMLILNTHLDTLTTLLMAKKLALPVDNIEAYIADGLLALEHYFAETVVVTPLWSKIESLMRNCLLLSSSYEHRLSRLFAKVIKRLYYAKGRYWYKKRVNVRAFSDGFLERDIRLFGSDLEYHVVNLWDMSKLLLWMNYNNWQNKTIEKQCVNTILAALKYCANAMFFKRYLQKISVNKGVSNEILEAIVIMMSLGYGENWLAELYFQYRRYAAPSCGILGLDVTVSGFTRDLNFDLTAEQREQLDVIQFAHGGVIFINNGQQDVAINFAKNITNWQFFGTLIKQKAVVEQPVSIPSGSIAIAKY